MFKKKQLNFDNCLFQRYQCIPIDRIVVQHSTQYQDKSTTFDVLTRVHQESSYFLLFSRNKTLKNKSFTEHAHKK